METFEERDEMNTTEPNNSGSNDGDLKKIIEDYFMNMPIEPCLRGIANMIDKDPYDLREILTVQPMNLPSDLTFYMDFVTGSREPQFKGDVFEWKNGGALGNFVRDGYTFKHVTVEELKNSVSESKFDEFSKMMKDDNCRLCLATSCSSSWGCLCGREYIFLYNDVGDVLMSYCTRLS